MHLMLKLCYYITVNLFKDLNGIGDKRDTFTVMHLTLLPTSARNLVNSHKCVKVLKYKIKRPYTCKCKDAQIFCIFRNTESSSGCAGVHQAAVKILLFFSHLEQ